jgi:hypothetical protein
MWGIGERLRTPAGSGRLLTALGAQVLVAATAAGYRLLGDTDPETGTTLADYADVALVSLFVAAYGAATVLLAGHLGALGHGRSVTRSLNLAGACMLAAGAENVVEDGFKVDRLVWMWVLLVGVGGMCLLLAGGTLMTVRGTRLLGLLVAAPPLVGLALDFAGWLPATVVSGVGIAVLVVRGCDRRGRQ